MEATSLESVIVNGWRKRQHPVDWGGCVRTYWSRVNSDGFDLKKESFKLCGELRKCKAFSCAGCV